MNVLEYTVDIRLIILFVLVGIFCLGVFAYACTQDPPLPQQDIDDDPLSEKVENKEFERHVAEKCKNGGYF